MNGSWPIYVGFLSMLAHIRRVFRRVFCRVFAGQVGPFTSGFLVVFLGVWGPFTSVFGWVIVVFGLGFRGFFGL